ncbi:MAG: hypothetical protein DRP67_01240 [Candidatus Omnitrophota bacterium]|nr:MAG: hypothetical protein DRP67_01240 [Candidatus Omnitrophota bacterium]
MKKRRKFLFLIDGITIFVCFLLGYFFRFYTPFFPQKGIPPLLPYLKIIGFVAPGWVIIFNSLGLYREKIFLNPIQELCIIIEGSFWAMIFLMAGTFLYRGFSYSRLAIGFGSIFSFLSLWIFHSIYLKLSPHESKKVMIAGEGKGLSLLEKRLKFHPYINFKISKCREIKKIGEKIKKERPDFIIAYPENQHEKIELRKISLENKIKLYFLPEVAYFFAGKIEDIDGLPLIAAEEIPFEKFPANFLKRGMDLTLGFIFFLIFCILLPFFSLLIKSTSKGPVFFKQKRVGKNGKVFKMFKFRTMKYPYEESPPYTLPDDPRLTRIGKFMRKYNLDELPQIFNVLSGEMSLVGPRPISVKDKIFFEIPEFSFRLKVKPGITGWAQIHGLRGGHFEPEERIRYDIYYIQNWSIWLDISIILNSFFSFKNAF